MAVPDYFFTEGFDCIGPTGHTSAQALALMGRWNILSGSSTFAVVAALSGTGYALQIGSTGAGSSFLLRKQLPGNFARVVGGVTFSSTLVTKSHSFTFGDGVSPQLSVTIDVTTGTISVRRGDTTGTIIATSTEVVIANTVNTLSWDITFHGTTGKAKIWLNAAPTSIDQTGIDTTNTANNFCNYFDIKSSGASGATTITVDHLYNWFWTAAGGTELPALTNPIIRTDFPVSDVLSDFSASTGVIGDFYRDTAATSATPVAGSLALRKFTAEANANLDSVSILPAATSASAKFKPVLYADNGSGTAPGSLIDDGPEVVGCTNGTTLTLPLNASAAIVAGTTYWIGIINDTTVTMNLSLTGTTLGYRAANTYASGAPSTAPAMTSGQATWYMWGNLSSVAVNWPQVSKNPPTARAYNESATVGNIDMFNVSNIDTTPEAIYCMTLNGNLRRTDAGARSLNLRVDSGGTISNGDNPDIFPSASFQFYQTGFFNDPNTGLPWVVADLNGADYGYEVAS